MADPFDVLPYDVWRIIIEDVLLAEEEYDTILALRATCKGFHDIIDQSKFNFVHLLIKSGEVCRRLNESPQNIFLTGPAGVGKSFIINRVKAMMDRRSRDCVVLAPTHAAAQLIPDGRTIHSYIGLRRTMPLDILHQMYTEFVNYRQSGKRYQPHRPIFSVKQRPTLIIIDEISMVGLNLLENVDFILRKRFQSSWPFGDAQFLLVGDFAQLPPVVDKYIFNSNLWRELDLFRIDLTRPIRHANDLKWFSYLQDVRCGKITTIGEDVAHLFIDEEKYHALMEDYDDKPIVLSSDNKRVEELNQIEFERLDEPVERTCSAIDDIQQAVIAENGVRRYVPYMGPNVVYDPDVFWRSPRFVHLKKGAQYVITANIRPSDGIYNGNRCTYEGNQRFKVKNGPTVPIETLFTNFYYMLKPNVILVRHQIALRLGYALTIHKSQGMTLSDVICDLSHIRSPGQYYVALSRVCSSKGLYLYNTKVGTKIPHIDGVIDFYKEEEEEENNIMEIG